MYNQPIRILHVVTRMARGGLETMLMNYYRHIDHNKIQFDFLEHHSDLSDYDNEIEELGGKIYRMPVLNPFSLKYRRVLDAFFHDHKEYNIVHAHINCMSALPLYYAKKNGVAVRIAHSHTSNQVKNLKYPLKMYNKWKIPMVATNLFACGVEAGKWMYGNREFIIMRNAIDMERFLYDEKAKNDIRRELRLGDSFVVGHIGRFYEVKNHLYLVDIFNEIVKRKDNAKLLLVGDGPMKERIQEKVRTYGLEKSVIFYGITDRVDQLLSAMDAFVLPSLYEGVPVTLVEARASGIKCFVSDTIAEQEKILLSKVVRISLSQSPEVWADIILKASYKYERTDTDIELVREYGITDKAKWLEDFYISKCLV